MTDALPLPRDPRIPAMIAQWHEYNDHSPWHGEGGGGRWLYDFERVLCEHYPNAPRKRLRLTARLAAPFPVPA